MVRDRDVCVVVKMCAEVVVGVTCDLIALRVVVERNWRPGMERSEKGIVPTWLLEALRCLPQGDDTATEACRPQKEFYTWYNYYGSSRNIDGEKFRVGQS